MVSGGRRGHPMVYWVRPSGARCFIGSAHRRGTVFPASAHAAGTVFWGSAHRGPMCFEFLLWGARRPGVVMRGGRRRQGRPLACSVTGWGVRHLPRPSPMASLSFHVKPGASSSGAGSSQLPKARNLEQLETASSGAGASSSRIRGTWSNGKVQLPIPEQEDPGSEKHGAAQKSQLPIGSSPLPKPRNKEER